MEYRRKRDEIKGKGEGKQKKKPLYEKERKKIQWCAKGGTGRCLTINILKKNIKSSGTKILGLEQVGTKRNRKELRTNALHTMKIHFQYSPIKRKET